MIQIDEYMGWPVRKLLLPEEQQIICTYCKTGKEPDRSVYDGNHNVYRLDKNGNVIWQITRVDYPFVNWESKHRHAQEEGLPGCIEPFIRFYVYRPDGTLVVEDLGPEYAALPPDVVEWQPGYTVKLANLGFGTQWFSLDVETGVANEITPIGLKAW